MSELEKDIKNFLDKNSLDYFETDNDFQVNCFNCGDKRHRLGISKKKGAWCCLNGGCGIKGTKFKNLVYAFNHKVSKKSITKVNEDEKEEVSKIKPNFHKQFVKILNSEDGKEAYEYLTKERELTKECVKHFELGMRYEFKKRTGGTYDAGDYISIPYIQDDKCVNIKYRKVIVEDKKDAKWRREVGGISALFNSDVTKDHDYDELFIAESEIDAMSLWSLGIKNVVGLTVGAKGFKVSWYDKLERYKKIYLVLDNDTAGQEGARKLAERLGLGRCYNVILPEDVKDPNDFIKKYNLDDFMELVEQGTLFDIPKVRSGNDLSKELFYKKFEAPVKIEEPKYVTPWRKINNILGPVRDGFLFILAGKPKSGKTTIALNLMKFWGEQGISTGIYSCEMRGERLLEKWLMMVEDYFPNVEMMDAYSHRLAESRLPLGKMFTFEPTEAEELTIDGLEERVEAMVKRYGLKSVIVDNLHYLCRGENENALISVATQKLKMLAEKLNILLIAITHPRKTNSNKQLTTDDLKGSSTIFQDADVVWLMHRLANDGNLLPEEIEGNGDGALSPMAEILITGRWTEGGKGVLVMNGGRSLFLDKGRMYLKVINAFFEKNKNKKKRNKKGF